MTEEKSAGVNRAGSTARTEAPATIPIRDAIYIIAKEGVTGARQFVARMPTGARWDAVRAVLDNDVNSRRTREENLRHLRHLLRVGQ